MRVMAIMVLDYDDVVAADPNVTAEEAIRALARAVCSIANKTVPVVTSGGRAVPNACTWSGFAWTPIDGMHDLDDLIHHLEHTHADRIPDIRAKWEKASSPIAVVHEIPIVADRDRLN